MDTKQAYTPAEGGRKRIEDAHGWVQPICQTLFTNPSLIEIAGLFLQDSQDGSGSVTCLQVEASGCVIRSFFVRSSYSLKAEINIPWKDVEFAVSKTVSAMVRIETVQGTKGRFKAIASRGEGGEGGR